MAKHLNVSLAFTADASQARAQIQELQRALDQLSTGKTATSSLGISKELAAARAQATQLGAILKTSLTPEGTLDLKSFSKNLAASGKTLTDYGQQLKKLGPDGQQAFAQVARSVTTANVSFQKTNGLLSEMWTTMKNTARWQITSSALHGLIGGLQSAIGYAKDLNKTLTDIRIVAPEKSMEDMVKFSKLANQQAKELSSTTLDYAKGALIYYQQGLDDLDVKNRTDVTTKMANVTGDSTDDVSSYMTAIWNNFNRAGDESEEHFADILTKLGAETAASTTEITTSLEKYSAVANVIGLSYEAATAAATTLIDRTREAPEVAGTALKTIFARIEGLKQEGSTDEGGTTTTLNKYSQALHNIGVEIKDQQGEMRDADQIIDDIGAKWKDLSKDQQIALAETVAGVRQWNQFAALMDNFDYYKKFKDMASFDSDGALQEQQDIYAESWEAASNRVKSSIQSIYMSLIDDQFFINLTNGIGKVVEGLNTLLSSIGGFKTILPALGLLMTKVFGEGMAKNIDRTVENMALMTKAGRKQIYDLRKEANQNLLNAVSDGSMSGNFQATGLKEEGKLTEQLIDKQQELANNKIKLTELEQNHAAAILDSVRGLSEEAVAQAKLVEQGQAQDKRNAEKAKRAIVKETGDSELATEFMQAREGLQKAAFADNAAKQMKEAGTKALAQGMSAKDTKAEMIKVFESVQESADAAEIDISEFIDKYNAAMESGASSTEAMIDAIRELCQATERDLEEADKKVEAFSDKLAGSEASSKTKQAVQDSLEASEMSADEAADASRKLTAVKDAAEEGRKAIDEFGNGVQSFGHHMTQMASAAMNVAMAISAFQNAIEVFSDPDATFMEQLIASLMAIGMIVPAITATFETLRLTNLKQIPISLALAMGWDGQAKSATKAAAAETAKAVADTGVAVAEEGAATATFTLAGAMAFLESVLLPILPIVLAVAAAVGAIAGVVYLLYKSTHHANDVFKELSASAEDTADNVEKLTSSFHEVLSVMEDFESKRDALYDMKKGTAEWAQAASELNSNMQDSIEKFNNLNDNISEYGPDSDLANINAHLTDEEKEIVGEEGFTSTDLVYGEDWAYDSQGIPYYTEAGQLKVDKITALSIQQANVTMNQATIAEDYASLDKKVEDFQLAGLFGGKNYQHSDFYKEQNPDTWRDMVGEELPVETFKALGEAIRDGNLMASDLEKSVYDNKGNIVEENKVVDYLQEYLGMDLENARSIADLIATNKDELASAIGDYGDSWKEISEKAGGLLAQNLATDESYQADLKEKMGDEDYDKYGSMVTTLSGEAAATYREQLLAGNTSVLYGKGKKYTDYQDAYAEEHGLLKEGDKYYKTDENGNKLEGDDAVADVGEETIKNWLASQKAEEHAKETLEDYLKVVEKTKENLKAYDKLKKVWEDQGDEIKKVAEKYKKLSKAEKETSKEGKKLAQFAGDIKDNFADVLDMELDDSIFDKDFIADNLEDIKDAMEGDVDAAERVRQAYAEADWKNFEANIEPKFDAAGYEGDIQSLIQSAHEAYSTISSELGNIPAGADLSAYTGSLEQLLATTASTKAQAESMLSDLGVDAEVEQAEIPAEEWEERFTNVEPEETPGVTLAGAQLKASNAGSQEFSGTLPDGDNPDGKTVNFSVPQVKMQWSSTGKGATIHGVKSVIKGEEVGKNHKDGQTITAWKLKPSKGQGTITKKGTGTIGGGGPSRRRAPGGGGGGGGGGGRRGGGGGRRTRAEHQTKTSQIDRYHDVNNKIARTQRKTAELQSKTDQLYGKKRLNNMKKINEQHEREMKLYGEKIKRAQKFLDIDKKYLQQEFDAQRKLANKAIGQNKNGKKLGIADFTFDEFGRINNYNDIMDKLQKELDKKIDIMNTKKTKEAQDDYAEKAVKPIQDAIKAIDEAVQQYEETYQEMLDQIDAWNDAYNEILEGNYEQLTYAVEIKEDLNDKTNSLLEYYIDKMSDNVYKVGELFDLYFGSTGQIAEIQKKIDVYTSNMYDDNLAGKQVDYLTHLGNLYKTGQITQANYVDGLQSEYDAMLDNLSALQDLKNSMQDYYANILDQVQNELNKYISQIEYATQALEHWQNVIELTGNGKEYDKLISVQTQLRNLAEQTYKNTATEYDQLYKNITEFEKANAELLASTDKAREEERQKAQDELNQMKNRFDEIGDELMSNYENLIETAGALLETQVEQANIQIDQLLSNMTGGFDELQKLMDLTSTGQDEYLTKHNQIYEMNKMLRTLRQDMDKTENKAAKQRLGNFQKELEALREKDELSNLELEIAQAKYKQLLAQIALEEAQNAKSIVRLRRDNEGNYGYVYTANQNDVDNAEQELEDAENDLYNIYLNANNDYNTKMVSYAQQMLQELADLNASGKSQEEIAEQTQKIQEKYADLIKDANDLMGIGQTGLRDEFNAANEAWTSAYDSNISGSIIPNLNNSVNDWLSALDAFKEAYNNFVNQYKPYEQEVVDRAIDWAEDAQKALTDKDGVFQQTFAKLDEAVIDLTHYIQTDLPQINTAIANIEKLLEKLIKLLDSETNSNGANTFFYYNKLMEWMMDFNQMDKSNLKYSSKGGYYLGNNKMNLAAQNYSNNAIAEEALVNVANNKHGWLGQNKDGKLIIKYIVPKTNEDYDKAVERVKKEILKEAVGSVYRFKTGGYTGDWLGEDGKLAMLHQKELVLNEQDTKNLLASVDIIRNVVDQIDLNSLSSNLRSLNIHNLNNQSLDQNVHITAEFPNVSDRNEIEAAFDNLVNRAAQYANRK